MKLIIRQGRKIALILIISLLYVSCSQYTGNNLNQTEESSPNILSRQVNKSDTGIELFKSIFFGMGDLANNINQLKGQAQLANELTNERKAEVLGKINILIKKIDNQNPNFFDNFRTKIISGNHEQVRIAIEEAGTLLKENIEVILPNFKKVYNKVKSDLNNGNLRIGENDNFDEYISKYDNASQKGEFDNLLNDNMISDSDASIIPCSWAIVCAAYFALAVHNTVGVVALIYFKAAFWGPSISNSRTRGDGDRLTRPVSGIDDSLRTETLINEIAGFYVK